MFVSEKMKSVYRMWHLSDLVAGFAAMLLTLDSMYVSLLSFLYCNLCVLLANAGGGGGIYVESTERSATLTESLWSNKK